MIKFNLANDAVKKHVLSQTQTLAQLSLTTWFNVIWLVKLVLDFFSFAAFYCYIVYCWLYSINSQRLSTFILILLSSQVKVSKFCETVRITGQLYLIMLCRPVILLTDQKIYYSFTAHTLMDRNMLPLAHLICKSDQQIALLPFLYKTFISFRDTSV